MLTCFEVRASGRRIALREAATAQQALLDYLRSLGCRDEDIVRLGPKAASWRGAVYSAAPAAA
jgi:hypothetical protein